MSDDVYAAVGSAIRARRDALGMTQAALASKSGLSRTSVTNIENGGQAIMLHQLLGLAKALRTDPCEFLRPMRGVFDEAEAPLTPARSDVAELLSRLDQPVFFRRR